MSKYDSLQVMVAWSQEYGVDVIGLNDGDYLTDVFAVVDKILYDDFSKEPIVESLRSIAFTFDDEGNRIRYNIKKDKLKFLKFLDNYYEISKNKLDKAYRLYITANNIEDYKNIIEEELKTTDKNNIEEYDG